jgi:hypothetical protein
MFGNECHLKKYNCENKKSMESRRMCGRIEEFSIFSAYRRAERDECDRSFKRAAEAENIRRKSSL